MMDIQPYDVIQVSYVDDPRGVVWEDYTTLRTQGDIALAKRKVRESRGQMTQYRIVRPGRNEVVYI